MQGVDLAAEFNAVEYRHYTEDEIKSLDLLW